MNGRKKIAALLFLFVLQWFIKTDVTAASKSIQEIIDEASPGEEIILPAGTYNEAIVVTKPLTISGDKVIIINNNPNKATVHIKSDRVTVNGLTVVHEHRGGSAVFVEGNENIIYGLTVRGLGTGVMLRSAHRNYIEQSEIIRDAPIDLSDTSMGSRTGSGIDLFESHDNVISANIISNALDGVYMEASHNNIVEYTSVMNSRYGFHLMFANNTMLNNNSASRNITGAMLMGTKGSTIKNNNFSKQYYHVHSQGLVLYDVHESTVTGNVFAKNLIGLYIERSTQNNVKENKMLANFVGLQLQQAESQTIEHNDFTTNVIQSRVTNSNNNFVQQNYWDTHAGLDFTGDGISEIPYQSDPIFLALVMEKPPFQLLAQSPGLQFLDLLLDKNVHEVLKDEAPLMSAFNNELQFIDNRSKFDPYIYSLLVLLSVGAIMLGGLRK